MITKYKEYILKESNTNISSLYDFIHKDKGSVVTLLHTTKDEETAKKIMENGLRYYQLNKTTDEIDREPITLEYNLMIRKDYGSCTIIIQLKKEYLRNINDYSSVKPYEDDESGETIYTLPKEFIKGYFNRKTGEIVKNPKFDPQHIKKELEIA